MPFVIADAWKRSICSVKSENECGAQNATIESNSSKKVFRSNLNFGLKREIQILNEFQKCDSRQMEETKIWLKTGTKFEERLDSWALEFIAPNKLC